MTPLDEIKSRLKRATDILFYPIDQPFIEEHIKDIERIVAACEVMREGLEKLSEFTDQSVYLITTDSLCRADKILGGGE